MEHELFLDDLVANFVILDFLKTEHVNQRGRVFLERVGPDVAKDYLREIIREKLPFYLIPDGHFYAFTPKFCSRYTKKDTEFSNLWGSDDELNRQGDLRKSFSAFIKSATEQRNSEEKIPINVLFYNRRSLNYFNKQASAHGLAPTEVIDLDIEYPILQGRVRLYTYHFLP